MITYKKILFGIFLFGTLISSTCKDGLTESNKAVLNSPFELAINENVIFSDIGVKIELSGINDSRCPVNVQCVWAGNANVNLNVSGSGMQSLALDLCLGQCANRFQEADTAAFNYSGQSYLLVLKKAEPYPGTADTKKSAVFVLKKD